MFIKPKQASIDSSTMTDARMTVDSISDVYDDGVDRQSILSVIMEVIADGIYYLRLRDIILEKILFFRLKFLTCNQSFRSIQDCRKNCHKEQLRWNDLQDQVKDL